MAEDKNTALDTGKARFIEKLGLYYENYGVPRIGGRIIGLLLTSDRPLSAEEMATRLNVSRSSVSTNIRLLLVYGFVEVSSKQDGRTDFFTIAEDAWGSAIKARIEGFLSLKAIVEQGIAALDGDAAATVKMLEMADWADTMLKGHERIRQEWQIKKPSH